MIDKIIINRYRKLNNISFNFSDTLNLISGANGTCKTSLLHLISNSFQAVSTNCQWLKNKNCLNIINKINNNVNPKVESLTKGDKEYNDPAIGLHGSLFTVYYKNDMSLEYRRHNSKKRNRYAIKPYYKEIGKEKLPFLPVIYLGLSRLLPYGEYKNETAIEYIDKSLPKEYQQEITKLYQNLTRINISSLSAQKMGDVKTRTDFKSDNKGIDSNTISAGEDNIFIILTALVSLKFYFNSIKNEKPIESILLIDELDATLHPSLQIKLLDLFKDFSKEYKIQIYFTTHSISLIEAGINKKINVTYLIDNIENVSIMPNPDIYKIRMNLFNMTSDEIFKNKKIPIFTEDNEAREFLQIIFESFSKKQPKIFHNYNNYFYLVNKNIGAEILINLFQDKYLSNSIMQSICILDGDHKNNRNLNNYTIVLPGNISPENLIFEYSISLNEKNDPFWEDEEIHNFGFYKSYFTDTILPEIKNIKNEIKNEKDKNEPTKGMERSLNKNVYNKFKTFFSLIFKHWVENRENNKEILKFYEDIKTMFIKTAKFHSIDPGLWEDK